MNKQKGLLSTLAIVLLVMDFLAMPLLGLAQGEDPQGEDGDIPVCNPVAQALADEMDIDCQDLLDLHQNGIGLGQIMKAWSLSQSLPGFTGTWQDLLQQKQAGIGWGQLKMAYQLADSNVWAEVLLALKESGIGWGQIKKAQVLAETGLISFEEVLQLLQNGVGWDAIRDQLGLEPGPPPWAGGGNDKDKGSQGPPPWANNDKDKGNSPPGQNGQGNGQGNDQGNNGE